MPESDSSDASQASSPVPSEKDAKRNLRAEARQRLLAQQGRDELSHAIGQQVRTIPGMDQAGTVMTYVHAREEVRTIEPLIVPWLHFKRIVIPYVVGEQLSLFWLRDLQELAPAAFGILEPLPALRNEKKRQVLPEELEYILVPGMAFDLRGGRLGHGKGFYDRLLAQVPPTTIRIGLAFETQIFDRIPCQPHDVRMHWIVTEQQCYCVS